MLRLLPFLRRTPRADTSQHGEVARLRTYLRRDWPRALVDIGAHDGSFLSNALPFVREGWSAILVEPHPKLFSQLSTLHAGNPRVRCVEAACADKPGVRPFFDGAKDNLSLSTLCTDENEWFRVSRAERSVPVTVRTLTDVLREADFPRDFSLLLVDAEGMDKEVLDGLDFDVFRPRLVLTEDYPWDAPKHATKERLLRERGYLRREQIGCNVLWATA